ncbi:LysR family transcriptional regulator [Butyricicoccus sp.]|uniref:LysR family transcriptional regulator n=1 Tax=Butyricicoccus sp. TaxID=2049021 RepID=UPI003AAD3C88
MLDLLELQQFVAFADCGTLSKAAEQLHISQPTLTRTMHHVEDAFGVPLFTRGKNRIACNETGLQAVAYARKLLEDADHAVKMVQAFDRSLHTIHVSSCAPAPLWSLLPVLTARFPDKTISSRLEDMSIIIEQVVSGNCEIGILPYAFADERLLVVPFLREQLSVCVPKSHPLAKENTLTFSQINGFNCLVRDQLGFWSNLCHEKMPASKFLVQTDNFALEELIRSSTLLCFTTNLAGWEQQEVLRDRVIIPLVDDEATAAYQLICLPKNKDLLKPYI